MKTFFTVEELKQEELYKVGDFICNPTMWSWKDKPLNSKVEDGYFGVVLKVETNEKIHVKFYNIKETSIDFDYEELDFDFDGKPEKMTGEEILFFIKRYEEFLKFLGTDLLKLKIESSLFN